MAKTNEQFDQHFREKLAGHHEKPSALAWERLESQLPKQSKPKLGIWWAIAASVTALLVAGYSFWPNEGQIPEESFLAEKTETPSEVQPETPTVSQEIVKTEEKPEILIKENQPGKKANTTEKTKPTPALTPAPQNLIAQSEKKTIESPLVIAVPELKADELPLSTPTLKAPDFETTVAQAPASTDEEPLYRVSIYSNGVKKGESPDKNLITELGKTVGQVEGLLGKVDDGLISLQDKKDNLFASLTSRKAQAGEKR